MVKGKSQLVQKSIQFIVLCFESAIKGTVSRDFPPPFFHQKYPTWTLIRILSFFRICFQICGVIRIKVKSLRSIMHQGVKSRRCILQRGVKSLRCIMQRGIKSRRCILQWGVKSCRCMMQQGVKSYRFMMRRGVNSYCA
jgi:hypothetical protein